MDRQEPTPASPIEGSAYINWDPEQGRHILGREPDQLEAGGRHFSVSIQPVHPASKQSWRLSVNPAGVRGANGTHLVADDGLSPVSDHVGTDPWFNDVILRDPTSGALLKIRRSEATETPIPSTVYFLDYQDASKVGTEEWVDYCGEGKGGAIPLTGYYNRRRQHVFDATRLSFACVDGTAHKCNRWGYPAGNAGPADLNWKYHQACTGMANANYCGTGQPFTREETPIRIRDEITDYGSEGGPYDLAHPVTLPGDPDQFYIEAGWLPNGRPLCLSRFRWAALSPDQCGAALPDPRWSDDKDVKFCDDWTIEQLFDEGAILVNGSKVMDAPLHRWRNALGDEVATIRGFYVDRDHDGMLDDPTVNAPFTDYHFYLGIEGMLLRNLPGTLDVSQMRALYSMQHPVTGDRYLDDTGTGRKDPRFEGYSFLNRPTIGSDGTLVVNLEPLTLCERGGDWDVERGSVAGCSPGTIKGLSFALPPPPP
ncbi:MAG TPA: ADYC domain-containing protein [Kofleriaceae bacterium]|nr:ADYC domain-containing protein [Kofleriaceae bacterium]